MSEKAIQRHQRENANELVERRQLLNKLKSRINPPCCTLNSLNAIKFQQTTEWSNNLRKPNEIKGENRQNDAFNKALQRSHPRIRITRTRYLKVLRPLKCRSSTYLPHLKWSLCDKPPQSTWKKHKITLVPQKGLVIRNQHFTKITQHSTVSKWILSTYNLRSEVTDCKPKEMKYGMRILTIEFFCWDNVSGDSTPALNCISFRLDEKIETLPCKRISQEISVLKKPTV